MRLVLLTISLGAFAICNPCRANIGDTNEQAVQRYGEPTHRYPVSGSNEFVLRWIKDGLVFDYYFDHEGLVYEEQYIKASPDNHLSEDEALHILASESDLTNWNEYRVPECVAWKSKIDGSAAVYAEDTPLLWVVKKSGRVAAILGGKWPQSVR